MEKYKRLKAELRRLKISYTDIATEINRSYSYVGKCLSGHNSGFLIAEGYAILLLIRQPAERFNYYFLET